MSVRLQMGNEATDEPVAEPRLFVWYGLLHEDQEGPRAQRKAQFAARLENLGRLTPIDGAQVLD